MCARIGIDVDTEKSLFRLKAIKVVVSCRISLQIVRRQKKHRIPDRRRIRQKCVFLKFVNWRKKMSTTFIITRGMENVAICSNWCQNIIERDDV